MDLQCEAVANIVYLIKNPVFQDRSKLHSSAFLRDRKLTFPIVTGMILRMIKQSLQVACNWLGDLVESEPASKQAFSKARRKISPECFQELFENGLMTNFTHAPDKGLWMNFRLIGVDGSTLRLPESDELAEEFGRWPTKEGAKESPPIARISEFSDMTTKLVLSGRIASCNVSEEELAAE